MKQDLTIIMYHYIRDFELTRNRGIRGLSTGGFRRQLDYLQNHYEIITMEQVVSAYRSKESLPNNAALLTFDDAYIEHYTIVFPELHRRGLQGSFFAPADPVLDSVLLDVNRLHFILAATLGNPELVSAHLDTAIREAKQEWGLDDVDAYRRDWAKPNRWDDAETIYIKRMLQLALPEDFRNQIAKKLFATFVTEDESAFATELYLREDQARLMQSCGMYFGSHGASHYWLDQIPEQKKRQDITRSLDFLNRIGSPVNDFWVMCYPYGAWDSETLRILEQYNCTFGLTTEVATANISSNNPLTLPRYDTNDFPQ